MRFIEWMDYKVCQILLQTGILLTELRYLIRGCLAERIAGKLAFAGLYELLVPGIERG